MGIQTIDANLFNYLMAQISGARFEAFAKLVFGHLYGETFVPLGGMHDGGADGLISSFVQEVTAKPSTYVQFSVTEQSGTKRKIADTIQALRKAQRDPKQLYYATSEFVPKSDVIAQDIHSEYAVFTSIRDRARLQHYLNTSEPANSAFHQFFSEDIAALSRAANTGLAPVNQFASDPTVYVFLSHELDDRRSKAHLHDRVVDALVYWALRDTDPAKDALLSRQQVVDVVTAAFPMARSVLLPRIDARLEELAKKTRGELSRLRHHKAAGGYCLPFALRQSLASEASACIARQSEFVDSTCERLRLLSEDRLPKETLDICADLVFHTVHQFFVEQGLLLAGFLERRLDAANFPDHIVEDILASVVSERAVGSKITPTSFGFCLSTLRGIFYQPSDPDHAYLEYLCRTSCLLVTIQSAPRLLEYFNKMGGNFRLLVGSDLLVKALSEQYLEQENQQVSNLFRVCKKLGAELVLTEPVLTEVFTHLHASDLEFRNHYEPQEQYLGAADIADCDRIMIRAYLHSRRTSRGPRAWSEFVNQLTDPQGLRSKSLGARDTLRGTVTLRFSMTYLSREELERAVPPSEVKALADRLGERRGTHEELNYNDSLMVYATYAQRRRHEEAAVYDGFGFRTWWLTKEMQILSLTAEIVRAEGGVPYIMRPEFLLNFVALASSAAEVRSSFAKLLPTTVGLQLGRHLAPEVMHNLMNQTAEWSRLPPDRVSTLMSERVNRLKNDRFKQYLVTI